MRAVRFRMRLLNISRCWSSTVKTLRGCRQAGNPDIWHVDCTKPGMDHWKNKQWKIFWWKSRSFKGLIYPYWTTQKLEFFFYGTWRYDDFEVKIPFLSYYLHQFPYKSLYPRCFEWSTIWKMFPQVWSSASGTRLLSCPLPRSSHFQLARPQGLGVPHSHPWRPGWWWWWWVKLDHLWKDQGNKIKMLQITT